MRFLYFQISATKDKTAKSFSAEKTHKMSDH